MYWLLDWSFWVVLQCEVIVWGGRGGEESDRGCMGVFCISFPNNQAFHKIACMVLISLQD